MTTVVANQESKPSKLLVEFIYAKPKQDKKYPVFKFPICKIKCHRHCWNYNCLKEIGRDIEWYYDKYAGKSYLVEIGTEIKHKCLPKGEGQFIKDGVQYKPILNEQNRKLLYKDKINWERKQITLGRMEYQKLFFNDAFYRSRHIESRIK